MKKTILHPLFFLLSQIAMLFISIGDLVIATTTFFHKRSLSFLKRISKRLSPRTKKKGAYYNSYTNAGVTLYQKPKPKKVPVKKTRRKKSSKKKTAMSVGVKIRYFVVGIVFSCLFIFIPLVTMLFLQELPHPKELSTRQIQQTSKIYDRNGTLLYEIYANQNRTIVPLSTIPKSLKNATLAIEDKNFYQHPGFDISAILRAINQNSKGQSVQGGSTITQQLIKSSMLTPEQSITRKLKEIVLAFWAERLYTKDEILGMYFNQIPYGGTAWGVEAASEVYFNKSVHQLNLAESAFLAGLTQAPSEYSPFTKDESRWKNRQKEVLRRMVALHYISQKEADEASKQKLAFNEPTVALKAPHFVNYVKDFLIKKYGLALVEKGGLIVTTSLDLKLQEKAQQVVADEIGKDGYLNISNGAAVIADPKTGDILAMVGSKDFYDAESGNVNLATSLRQPGSTVKVITYAAALSNGLSAASILDDTPVTYTVPGGQSYSPVNYDGKYRGKVPLRLSLANSLNIPAVRTLQQIGVPTMIRLARDMGISSWNEPDSSYGLSTTLGSSEVTMLDMVSVNSTLANEGRRIPLNPILKITDYKGDIVEEKEPTQGEQILQQGVAFIINDILADNAARSLAFGPNSPLNIPGQTVSVKTGTTDNKRDNWTNGYTQDIVISVWVGNNNNAPMNPSLASGITGAAPIWNQLMIMMLKDKPSTKPEMPSDVVALPCGARTEYFLAGTQNTSGCRLSFPSLTVSPTKSQ
ncbi:MAG: penicillin-binding protein [Candidatus Levybacteria bacterium]|nr:penicillin-binding protein [Candidatus Levybacteria bacterium]